jgi:Na+-transporting NADH:ubiquinone oxidoreductase subunit NqrB
MEYIGVFLNTFLDSFFSDIHFVILISVLFLCSLKPQALIFSVIEIVCVAVSAIDVFMTGSLISAIILALLLGPRIPLVFTAIICVILSTADFIFSDRWRVHKVNPTTGKRVGEVAYLSNGKSEKAEWTPRGTGTFELEVTYFYDNPVVAGKEKPFPATGKVDSYPHRIVVEK